MEDGSYCRKGISRRHFQADATLPIADRRNYKGVFDALKQIVQQEGVTGLWAGSLPTVVRAMALNVGMLSTFDQVSLTLVLLLVVVVDMN